MTAPAPSWATANHKAPYTYRPDPLDFQEFMTAVARHYGSQVSLYSIWNEPNEPAYLTPQWSSSGKPVSGFIYRGLYQAGYLGLQKAGLTHPRVLFGETAPVGYDTVNVRREKSKAFLHPVAPLAVHARSAVPERQVQESRDLQRAADERLRPPRLLPGGRSQVCLAAEGQRHDRLALAPVQRSELGRASARDPAAACRST